MLRLFLVVYCTFAGIFLGDFALAKHIDFQFFGFDNMDKPLTYSYENSEHQISSDMRKQGLSDLFEGKGFYNGVPLKVFDYIKHKKMEKLDDWKVKVFNKTINFLARYFSWAEKYQFVSPFDQDGQFFVYGRTPSPPTRNFSPQLEENKVGLTQSVFMGDKGEKFLNNNCLTCHSGVAYGVKGPMVVAGLGNNYIDQFSMVVEAAGTADLLEDPKFNQELRDHLKGENKQLTGLEEEQLAAFIKKIRTTVVPTFRFSDSVGFNAGPFGVWTLLARLIDPKNFGFQTFAFKRNTPDDLTNQLDWIRFKKVYGESYSDEEIWKIYNKAYDEFDAFRKQALAMQLPPVMPNAWFLRKYRKAWGYWYGDKYAGFDKYAGVHFAQNFTDEHPQVNEHHGEHSKNIASILNFANSTEPPPYPGKLDGEKVKKGRDLFHNNTCVKCHGTYTKEPGYEDHYSEVGHWIVDYTRDKLADVGTDSKYNEILQKFSKIDETFAKEGKERVSGLKEFWTKWGEPTLAPGFSFPDKAGYYPPPLVGLWATGPYFHNGSVPELEQVLNSAIRPKVWTRIDLNDESELSTWDAETKTGIPNQALDEYEVTRYTALKAKLKKQKPTSMSIFSKEYLEFRRVFDTTDFGKSNDGHKFGDKLSDEERSAVIEFLKSISGTRVVAKADYELEVRK